MFGFIYCNAVVSKISHTSVFYTYSSFASNDSFEGVLGSAHNIICQIFHSLGHYAISCPVRYQPKHTSSIPTVTTFSPIEAVESLQCPDLAATTYMSPYEGILSCFNSFHKL